MTVYVVLIVLHIYASSPILTSFIVAMRSKRPTTRTNKALVPIIPCLVPGIVCSPRMSKVPVL